MTALPERFRHFSGHLSYSTGDGDYQPLPGLKNDPRWNVSDFLFDYRLQFCQRISKDQAVCTLAYPQGQYVMKSLENAGNHLVMSLDINGTGTITTNGKEAEKANEFPLAKLHASFRSIKLTWIWIDFKPRPQSIQLCRQILVHFTTARVANVEIPAPSSSAAHVAPTMSPPGVESSSEEKAAGLKVQLATIARAKEEEKARIQEDGDPKIREAEAVVRQLRHGLEEKLRRVDDERKGVEEAIVKELEKLS